MTSDPQGPSDLKRRRRPSGDQVLKWLRVFAALASTTWSAISIFDRLSG